MIYQSNAVCGADSVVSDSDCAATDARGAPHLAPGHPVGASTDIPKVLRGYLGDDLEVSPIISYGNFDGASPAVWNELVASAALTERFTRDAIALARDENLTGFNFDLEFDGMDLNGTEAFLRTFADGLRGEGLRVTYDTLARKPVGGVSLDSWIAMGTYEWNAAASSVANFQAQLDICLYDTGGVCGVGFCPSCYGLSEADLQGRFDLLAKTPQVRDLAVWAVWATAGSGNLAPNMDHFWPRLEAWLQDP